MASFNHKKLSDDTEYYAKAYAITRSKYVDYSAESWHGSFLELEDMKKVVAGLDTEEQMRILTVGSGPGEDESQLIHKLLARYSRVHSTVIEPSEDYIRRYQSLASKGDLSQVTWDWRQQTWEGYWQFRKSSRGASKFHFILAIQVLYHVDDVERAVIDMMSCLEDGGLLVIMLAAGDTSYMRLHRAVGQLRFMENTAHVAELLQKHQIQFSEVSVPTYVEVTGCLENEDDTADEIIDFITQVSQFRKTAPPDVVTVFMEALQRFSIRRGDSLLLEAGSSILFAKK